MKKSFEKELLSHSAHLKDINHLPETGWSRDEIIAQTKIYLGLGEFDWRQGTQSGTVYNGYYFKMCFVKQRLLFKNVFSVLLSVSKISEWQEEKVISYNHK